jgi:hypothetical protein
MRNHGTFQYVDARNACRIRALFGQFEGASEKVGFSLN